jgi:hypothetical protein
MNILRTFLITMTVLPTFAFAGQTLSNTTIDNVRVKNSIAYIKFSHCARYSQISLNSDYAKAMFSTALTAGASKNNVTVEFKGEDCSAVELQLVYLDVNFNA